MIGKMYCRKLLNQQILHARDVVWPPQDRTVITCGDIIGFKPPLDPVKCKGGAYARGRRHVTARASRIDNMLLRLGRRVTTGDQAVFFLFSLRHDV